MEGYDSDDRYTFSVITMLTRFVVYLTLSFILHTQLKKRFLRNFSRTSLAENPTLVWLKHDGGDTDLDFTVPSRLCWPPDVQTSKP
jgi:hypothetical protein